MKDSKSKKISKSKKSSESKKSSKKDLSTESEVSDSETINEIIEEETMLSDSDQEYSINTETEISDCILDKMIEDDNNFFDNEYLDEYQTFDNKEEIVPNDKRITNPRLTKYEYVRILGERKMQLIMGAAPLIKNHFELEDEEEIAIEELKHNMIPLKIKRPLPNNKYEIWDIKELDKKHLDL